MGCYFGHDAYVTGYIEGYYMARLLVLFRMLNMDNDNENVCRAVLNESFPNMPEDLVNQLLELVEVQSEDIIGDKEDALFEEYKWYFETLPGHEEVEKSAEKAWDERCTIIEYENLIDYIKEYLIKNVDYKKEKIVLIDEIRNCRFNDLYINGDSPTGKRIKAVNKFLKDSSNLAGIESNEEIAKKLFNEETEEFRLYRINNVILYVKSFDEYAIYKIENFNRNKPWILSSDTHGSESICLVECNRYNQIVEF